jgi:uncharacterized protein (DUF433 family)
MLLARGDFYSARRELKQGSHELVQRPGNLAYNESMDHTIASYIVSAPDRCGGRPHIAGTRIRIQDIVADHEYHGLSAEEIAREYPHLSLAQVYAALAYYFDHRDEIRRQMKADEDLVEAVQQAAKARID